MVSGAGAAAALVGAVKAAVAAAGPVRAGSVGVFDAPPQGATPPYVVVGPVRTRDASTKTEAGWEHRLSVRVTDLPARAGRAVGTLAAVEAALAAMPRAAAGYRWTEVRLVSVVGEAGAKAADAVLELGVRSEGAGNG